jgi:hypothetical protein
MQITISVSHTFEDAERFAEFAPELKAFLDRFFSGPALPPAAPVTRGMTPRESAVLPSPMVGETAPPAVPSPPAQPAPIYRGGAGGAAGENFGMGGGTTPLADKPVTITLEGAMFGREQVTELVQAVEGATAVALEDKPKRKRRTKAEMAAARASGAVAPLPNAGLPSAGSFGGPATTSAPPAPAAEPDPFDPFNPASVPAPKPAAATGLTHSDVKAAFAPLLMHDEADKYVLEVLGRFGLTKVNECIGKPELFAPLIEAFTALRKQLGV